MTNQHSLVSSIFGVWSWSKNEQIKLQIERNASLSFCKENVDRSNGQKNSSRFYQQFVVEASLMRIEEKHRKKLLIQRHCFVDHSTLRQRRMETLINLTIRLVDVLTNVSIRRFHSYRDERFPLVRTQFFVSPSKSFQHTGLNSATIDFFCAYCFNLSRSIKSASIKSLNAVCPVRWIKIIVFLFWNRKTKVEFI